MEKRRHSVLAVFSEFRLVKKFGQKGFAQICKHLIPIADEFLDVRAGSLRKIKEQVKTAVASNSKRILIIGGHDVVPFQTVKNPARDGDIIYTDDPYADADEDGIIDIPVARIPDGGSLKLVMTQLSQFSEQTSGSLGLANQRRRFAKDVFSLVNAQPRTFLQSPPTTSISISEDALNQQFAYFLLHGLNNQTALWWGAEPTYPVAFDVSLAISSGIVLASCCYGAYVVGKRPSNSICLTFLKNGCRAFIGSTASIYSGIDSTHYSGLLQRLFITHLNNHWNEPLEAFFLAKQDFARQAAFPQEHKMKHAFVYYGR